jgi:hypothetical protein
VYRDIIPPGPVPTRGKVSTIAVLIAGTLIGGLLVLVAILAFSLINRDRSAVVPPNQPADLPVKNSNLPKTTPTALANADIASNSSKEQVANRTAANSSDMDSESLAKKGFNGRVIMINAVIRSLPSVDSDEVAVVPFDEPIKIGKPATEHSPWYRVTTSDGTTGWMHGNTIEFVK